MKAKEEALVRENRGKTQEESAGRENFYRVWQQHKVTSKKESQQAPRTTPSLDPCLELEEFIVFPVVFAVVVVVVVDVVVVDVVGQLVKQQWQLFWFRFRAHWIGLGD